MIDPAVYHPRLWRMQQRQQPWDHPKQLKARDKGGLDGGRRYL